MPQTRKHPHSREEWDAIRPLFTRLYKTEGKKLSEVIEILGEKGFHAEELHYKRRINTWGLNKNRRESDMVNAALIIEQRRSLGKDTRLRIREEIITPADVQKYWKRKPYRPEDSPYFTGFSGDIQSWTPISSPALRTRSALPPPEASFADSNQTDRDNEPLCAGEMALMDLGGDEPLLPGWQIPPDSDLWHLGACAVDDPCEYDPGWQVETPSVPPLWIPAVHSSQETFNFYANVYTRVGVEKYREKSTYDLHLDNFSCTLVAHYLQRSLRPTRFQIGNFTIIPELKPMPTNWFLNVLDDNHPVLLPCLFLGLVHGIGGLSIEDTAEVWRAEASELLASIRRKLGSATTSSSYSLLRMLEVLDVDNVKPFSDTISDLMPDVFKVMAIDDKTILAAQLFLTLGQISKVNKSRKAAHIYLSKADRVLQLGLDQSEVTTDEELTLTSGTLTSSLHCRYYLRWLDSLALASAPAAVRAGAIDQQALRFKIDEELRMTIIFCSHQIFAEIHKEVKKRQEIIKEEQKELKKRVKEKMMKFKRILENLTEKEFEEILKETDEGLKRILEGVEEGELEEFEESLKENEEEFEKLDEI